jgi:hypothetical protein
MDWMNCGLELGRGKKFFSSPNCPGQLWGPSSHLFNGYLFPFPGVEWLGHKVDLTPSSNAKVKNKLSLNLPFPQTFMGWTTLPFPLNAPISKMGRPLPAC